MRGTLQTALIMLLSGCAGASAPVTPAQRAGRAEATRQAPPTCTPTREVGDDGWTRFTLCSPVPAWPGNLPRPRQGDVGVPRPVVEAHERLLALGLPDVRGGDLREVEIVVPDVWGQNERRRLVAIVLPGDDAIPRFAVVAPGLAWPVTAMGEPLDFVASCERALALLDQAATLDRQAEERWDLEEEANGQCPLWLAWPMLVDDGRVDLAARSLATVSTSSDEIVRASVVAWLRSMFERAITHYMQREDAIARADTAAIERLRETAISLGVDAGELGYLDTIRSLTTELERRASLSPRAAVEPPPEGPVPSALVPALIDALDEVDARQWGQPGGVSLARDERVDALIRAGEPAIPALLECVESDQRLTRSVHFWRDFVPDRSILGVHEACYVALASIIDEDFFVVAATGDNLSAGGARARARVAQAVRRYWARWGSVTPVERRWHLLSDDSASPDRWAQAADWLTAPAPEPRESTIQIQWVGPDGPEPMQGEPLREARGDALLRLFVQRARQAQVARETRAACGLLSAAIEWAGDPPPAEVVPLALACEQDRSCPCRAWLAGRLGHQAPAVATAWLASVEAFFGRGSFDVRDDLEVLVTLLDIPAVAEAIGLQLQAVRREGRFTEALAHNPSAMLIEAGWVLASHELPAAFDLLDRALASRRRIARLEMYRGDDGAAATGFPIVRHATGWWGVELPEPLDSPREVRASDLTARILAQRLSVPFSLGWDEPRRDAAITEMRALLERMRREERRPPPVSAASPP